MRVSGQLKFDLQLSCREIVLAIAALQLIIILLSS